MSSTADTVQTIKQALAPYIRPREEVAHIRRVLALKLRSCHENGPQNGPLALAEPDCTIKTTDVRGLQRDYLKALHTNVQAQRAYESVSQQQVGKDTRSAKASALTDTGRLDAHLAHLKLRRKQERLQTMEEYLDVLAQKPAASPGFLQPVEIFRGSSRLPNVPKTIASRFTVDNSSTKTDLKALVDRLEKAVLQSKLLLKNEEQLLEQVKARSTVSPGRISDGAKLAALSATRNELITWMETELGKASAVEEPIPEDGQMREEKVDKAHINDQLALIRDKYTKYIVARKSLIQLVAQSPQPSIRSEAAQTTVRSAPPLPAFSTYMIAPYVEHLLSIAHEQKASITQKSHISNVLAKQTEETSKAMSRLAEESQLLPENPLRRRQERLDGAVPQKRRQEITARVQPWVSAADAAKLATLEAVAENIEIGQNALETSTKHLAEIDQLLGRDVRTEDESVDGDSTADIWLAETQTPRKEPKPPSESKSATVRELTDVWSLLDGNLGLIDADDSPRK